MLEFLDGIQIFIPNFCNSTSKLQFLSMSVLLLYKILGVVFYNATISLPVCCNAYRNNEQSAATLKHD